MKRSIVNLTKQLESIKGRISKIQEHCKHINTIKKHCGDTGNYDPSNDCYWTEITCHDCGKFWTEEGNT